MRFGAVADAFAHQTFSVTKKVEGDLPESAQDLEYPLTITLKNDADPSVNKTYQATVKAGETYTYPTSLSLGTVVTVSEGDLPAGVGITWNDAESRIFQTVDGVTLSADNREATFTLSEDHLFALNLNNKLVPTPKPMPTPTPTPTPSESRRRSRPRHLRRLRRRAWPRPVLTRRTSESSLESWPLRVVRSSRSSVVSADPDEGGSRGTEPVT